MKSLIIVLTFLLLPDFAYNGHALCAAQDTFTWHVFSEGNLTLYCQEEDFHLSDELLASAAEALSKLVEVIPAAGEWNAALVVAPSEQVYQRVTGGIMPEWSSGAANPGAGMIYLKSPRITNPSVSISRIICHELSHVLLGMATGFRPVERWFDEGLAEYMSGRLTLNGLFRLARSAGSGDLHSFEELNGMLGFGREEALLAYMEARSAIEYLIKTYGKQSLKTVIGRLAETNMDDAMRQTLGLGLDQFETGWKSDLRQRYRWSILMDASTLMTLVFILLFFMALIATFRRVRMRKREWEEEVGEQA